MRARRHAHGTHVRAMRRPKVHNEKRAAAAVHHRGVLAGEGGVLQCKVTQLRVATKKHHGTGEGEAV